MLAVPGVNGYDPELDRRLPHDLEGARRLLAEAGYPGGFAVPLLCQSFQEPACRVMAEQLARVGIRATPDIIRPRSTSRYWTGRWQPSGSTAWVTASSIQPISSATSTTPMAGWNRRATPTPELDALIDTVDSDLPRLFATC